MEQVRNGAHALWRFLIAIFAAAAVVQVFFAGLGVFRADDEGENKKFEDAFNLHSDLGWFMTIGSLLILVVALVAWRDRSTVGLSAVLFGLLVLQNILAGLGEDHPWIGGFHPLNGFLILGFSGWLASRTWGKTHGGMPRTEPAPPPPA